MNCIDVFFDYWNHLTLSIHHHFHLKKNLDCDRYSLDIRLERFHIGNIRMKLVFSNALSWVRKERVVGEIEINSSQTNNTTHKQTHTRPPILILKKQSSINQRDKDNLSKQIILIVIQLINVGKVLQTSRDTKNTQ